MKIHATSQDGVFGIIEAKDYPPGIPRSKTADTVGDAMKGTWEPALVTAPGPKSARKFIMVKVADLPAGFTTAPTVSPKDFKSPTFSKKHIPDYPHKCLVCGGNVLILFSSTEHEGGACPGRQAALKKKVRA